METGSGNFAFSPFNIYEFEKAFAFAFTLSKNNKRRKRDIVAPGLPYASRLRKGLYHIFEFISNEPNKKL